jgi:hypothetical protein
MESDNCKTGLERAAVFSYSEGSRFALETTEFQDGDWLMRGTCALGLIYFRCIENVLHREQNIEFSQTVTLYFVFSNEDLVCTYYSSRCTDGTLLLRWVHLTRLRPEVDNIYYYYYNGDGDDRGDGGLWHWGRRWW